MFDCLRATDNRGVENDFVLYFPREPVRFFDKTIYTGTGRSLWILPIFLKALLSRCTWFSVSRR